MASRKAATAQGYIYQYDKNTRTNRENLQHISYRSADQFLSITNTYGRVATSFGSNDQLYAHICFPASVLKRLWSWLSFQPSTRLKAPDIHEIGISDDIASVRSNEQPDGNVYKIKRAAFRPICAPEVYGHFY